MERRRGDPNPQEGLTHRFGRLELKLTALQIDLRIITWAWMMFMALDLNRRNINRGGFPARWLK